jgi:hypothetical protein
MRRPEGAINKPRPANIFHLKQVLMRAVTTGNIL